MSEARLEMEQRMRQIEEEGRDTDVIGLIRETAEAFARYFQKVKATGHRLPYCKQTLARYRKQAETPPFEKLSSQGRPVKRRSA